MHPAAGFKKELDDSVPFDGLNISNKWKMLAEIDERTICPLCGKSRKYFCYTCYVPVAELEEHVPKLNLPLKVDIIKHAREIDGKSTAAHAAVLAPNDVRILTYPCIPDYNNDDGVVLIYPEKDAYSVAEIIKIFKERNMQRRILSNEPVCKKYRAAVVDSNANAEIDNVSEDLTKISGHGSLIQKAVFIDATWNQSKGIYKDKRLKGLPRVILRSRISQFWRHQKGSPRWYLATIEAIHQFLVELHESLLSVDSQRLCSSELRYQTTLNSSSHVSANEAMNNENLPTVNNDNCINISDCNVDNSCNDEINTIRHYNGEYDNLLFFFRFMYSKIHTLYNHDTLMSYKRPLE